MNRISKEEIKALYEEYKTPEHVKRHCRAVAETACTIACELNACGYRLDTELIMSAGLCHDTARVLDEHWNVMADRLEEMGYKDEAAIVRVHMNASDYSELPDLNETDMICIADRLVIEDEYQGIDKRFEYIVNKAKRYGVTNFDRIYVNKAKMQAVLDGIESVTGKTIDSLFAVDKNMD